MKNSERRILVDMCLTTVHHGHIRILHKGSLLGQVIVGLATDEEIFKTKGFQPELTWENRKEIALAIKYVKEVIEAPMLIDDAFLELHKIDFLVHGDDNVNPVSSDRLITFPRTKGISSSILRGADDD